MVSDRYPASGGQWPVSSGQCRRRWTFSVLPGFAVGVAFSRSEVTFLSRSDVFGSVHCFGSHIPSRLPFAQQICAAATGSRTNSLRSGLCRNTLTLLTAGLPPSRCPSRRCPFSATVANVMQIKSKA